MEGNGTDNITTQIATYNAANPTRTIVLTAGDGTQIIANKSKITLANGTDNLSSTAFNVVGRASNIGGTTTAVGVTTTGLNGGVTDWTMSAEADDTNNALVITATGKAGTTIYWSALVEWHPYTFA